MILKTSVLNIFSFESKLMAHDRQGDESWEKWDGEACVGCDLPSSVNDLGLCVNCAAKLDRDMIRAREWDHTTLAFGIPRTERESLRLRIMREYGQAYELMTPPSKAQRKANKVRASGKSTPIRELPGIEPRHMGEFTELDVVDILAQILASSPHAIWHELSEVVQILRRYFPDLDPRVFGYKRLRHLIQAHPKRFQTQWDNPKQKHRAMLYIRLVNDR